MITVVLVVHLLIALSLVGVALLQKSEGGALGMGGGGMSGFMTGRSTANLLTRTTAVLAACFMLTVLQRRLSTPARELRRRTVSLTGEQRLDDGSIVRLDAARIAAPSASAPFLPSRAAFCRASSASWPSTMSR